MGSNLTTLKEIRDKLIRGGHHDLAADIQRRIDWYLKHKDGSESVALRVP